MRFAKIASIKNTTNHNSKTMKNTDILTRRIAAAGIAICGILLCSSIFIFTLNNVTKSYAAPNAPIAIAGDIMMAPYMSKDSEVILIWNTTTGKSVSWCFDNADQKYKKSPAGFQLPASPMN